MEELLKAVIGFMCLFAIFSVIAIWVLGRDTYSNEERWKHEQEK